MTAPGDCCRSSAASPIGHLRSGPAKPDAGASTIGAGVWRRTTGGAMIRRMGNSSASGHSYHRS
jgi:hypothetical protein